MKQDIRVDVTFPDHVKTKRLVKECGEGAFRCLVRLWTWAAVHKPSGDLTGLSIEEIEDEAGWTGEPGKFFAAISSESINYLDIEVEGTVCLLHDWREHQPWIIGAKKREAAARTAAKARWDKKKMPPACEAHKKGNADSMPLSFPFLSSPKTKEHLPEALRLAGILANKILEHSPNYRYLQSAKKEKTINRWALDIEKMIRIDKRVPGDIEKIIIWATADTFWQSNILSGDKLRIQYDALVLQYKSSKKKQGGNSKSDSGEQYAALTRQIRELENTMNAMRDENDKASYKREIDKLKKKREQYA